MTDHEAVTLTTLAQELLAEARSASAGRSAQTLTTGPSLRATAIALTKGAQMDEHQSPPAATLQVLVGEIRLNTAERDWRVRAGDLLAIPPFRHSVDALADSVFLLTVSLH